MSDTTRTVDLSVKPEVTPFFDTQTNTVSYVVKDPGSNACAVIDALMDIDYAAGRIAYKSADKNIAFIAQHGLKLEWLIETHVHADHLSGARYIQGKLGGKIGIGERIAKCRIFLARSSTKVPNSGVTVASLTASSRTVTAIRSAP